MMWRLTWLESGTEELKQIQGFYFFIKVWAYGTFKKLGLDLVGLGNEFGFFCNLLLIGLQFFLIYFVLYFLVYFILGWIKLGLYCMITCLLNTMDVLCQYN